MYSVFIESPHKAMSFAICSGVASFIATPVYCPTIVNNARARANSTPAQLKDMRNGEYEAQKGLLAPVYEDKG